MAIIVRDDTAYRNPHSVKTNTSGSDVILVTDVNSSALPTGAATEAKQDDNITQTTATATILAAAVDGTTTAFRTITYEHHEIHSGSHYFVEDVADLAINNVYDLQFTTPNTTKWGHFTFELNCESETDWYIYEGATIVTPATAITARNNNRNSATASGMTLAGAIYANLAAANAANTVTAPAIELNHGIIGAGRNGGIIERSREIILKQNTVYIMRAIANAAGYTNFYMSWYEHTNP